MKYAWLFPGQGAQKVGMGKALVAQSSKAKEIFDRADEALGFSISKICFEGPDADLLLTKNTQPAILTKSIAALAAVKEAHPNLPKPSFVAGHSLGEYSALVAAEALSLEDALHIVHARGAAMQEAVPAGKGAMAAIMGGDHEAVENLCRDAAQGDVLSPANFNAPGQIVIAGDADAVSRAVTLAKERKLKGIPLKVSAPFHCALMKPAAEKVREALAQAKINAPQVPVIANITGKPNSSAEAITDLLVQQVDSAVLWDRSIELLATQGVEKAIEFGPGKVLAGLVKRINKSIEVKSVGTPESMITLGQFF